MLLLSGKQQVYLRFWLVYLTDTIVHFIHVCNCVISQEEKKKLDASQFVWNWGNQPWWFAKGICILIISLPVISLSFSITKELAIGMAFTNTTMQILTMWKIWQNKMGMNICTNCIIVLFYQLVVLKLNGHEKPTCLVQKIW